MNRIRGSRAFRAATGCVVVGLTLAWARAVSAQIDICVPSTHSHEANAFGVISVPFAFSAATAPAMAAAPSLGVEIASLPTVSRTDATPTACRPGKGPENTNPIPVLVRPRLTWSWHGVVAEVSWIPPVRVDQVKADLVGVALAHVHRLDRTWAVSLRAEGVFGSLRAPVTCDDAAIRDPASDCYGGTRSDDRWQPNILGVETAVGRRIGVVQPYAGVGYSRLRPRFEVNFTDAADSTDHRRIEVNLVRIAVFAGITVRLDRATISAEAYATPADAVAARVVVRTLLVRRSQ
jgi:hypothetical protein